MTSLTRLSPAGWSILTFPPPVTVTHTHTRTWSVILYLSDFNLLYIRIYEWRFLCRDLCLIKIWHSPTNAVWMCSRINENATWLRVGTPHPWNKATHVMCSCGCLGDPNLTNFLPRCQGGFAQLNHVPRCHPSMPSLERFVIICFWGWQVMNVHNISALHVFLTIKFYRRAAKCSKGSFLTLQINPTVTEVPQVEKWGPN